MGRKLISQGLWKLGTQTLESQLFVFPLKIMGSIISCVENSTQLFLHRKKAIPVKLIGAK